MMILVVPPIPPSEQMLLTQPANKDHATSSLSDFSTSSDDSFIDSDHYKRILKSSKKVKKRFNNLARFKKGRKKMKTTKQPKKDISIERFTNGTNQNIHLYDSSK